MTEINFIEAFGRLLLDASLRDTFAVNPLAAAQQVRLQAADHSTWEQLVPAELEAQAGVLLAKRLDLVKFFAPETCHRLGEAARPAFRAYARTHWPRPGNPKSWDAFQFCQWLNEHHTRKVVAAEWNRLAFAFSRHKFALHWVEIHVRSGGGKTRRGLQLFFRGRGQHWREWLIYLQW